jgi:methionyl-tRNA synthetase
MDVARSGNRYLTENEPWKLFSTDPEKTRDILQNCLHIVAHLGTLMQSFLPVSSQKIFGMLNFDKEHWFYDEPVVFEDGHQLGIAKLLFEKVEDAAIENQIQKLKTVPDPGSAQPIAAPAKADITYEQFSALDIRTGTILAAEKVAKTKKLLKLLIDTGIDKRTVVSGIAEYYEPENIIGQQISLIINLAPREIKGILSQGMILMAENAEGKLSFVAPADKFAAGSVIR